MQKTQSSIKINAPAKKVWDTMLQDETYRIWTEAFAPGCYFEGSWDKGSKIKFLAKDSETGKSGGMTSEIEENRPYEFISIKHLGVIADGIEDTTSEDVQKWAGAHENYTLKEVDGVTEVIVDIDIAEEMVDIFNEMWPKALE